MNSSRFQSERVSYIESNSVQKNLLFGACFGFTRIKMSLIGLNTKLVAQSCIKTVDHRQRLALQTRVKQLCFDHKAPFTLCDFLAIAIWNRNRKKSHIFAIAKSRREIRTCSN